MLLTLSKNFSSYYFYLLIIFTSHLLILEWHFPTCECRSYSMGSLHPSGHQALSIYGTIIYLTHIRTPCSHENGDVVIINKVQMHLKSLLSYLLAFLLIFSQSTQNITTSRYRSLILLDIKRGLYIKKHFRVSAVLLESEPFEAFLMHVSSW